MSNKHLNEWYKKAENGVLAPVNEISLNPKNLTQEDLSALALAKRVYGSPRMGSFFLDSLPPLEKVRTQIAIGEFRKMLASLPETEGPDVSLALEKLRALFFQGDWSGTLKNIQTLILQSMAPGNLALVYQIKGASEAEIFQLHQSADSLSMSYEIYRAINNNLGSFLTLLLMSKTAVLKGSEAEGLVYFREANSLLKSEKFGFKQWLALARTALFSTHQMSDLRLQYFELATWLSTAMGDEFHRDLTFLELNTTLINPQEYEGAGMLAAHSPRHAALVNKKTDSASSYWWFNCSQRIEDEARLNYENTDSLLLANAGVFLSAHHQTLEWYPAESPKFKVLFQLIKSGGSLSREQLFEAVWGHRWNKEKHGNLLNVTIKSLRSSFPDLIESSSDVITLLKSSRVLYI